MLQTMYTFTRGETPPKNLIKGENCIKFEHDHVDYDYISYIVKISKLHYFETKGSPFCFNVTNSFRRGRRTRLDVDFNEYEHWYTFATGQNYELHFVFVDSCAKEIFKEQLVR